ncbi:MAG: exodeoxyribonuclease VII large subunit [Patescibacteria group bacterium]|jgi:exodeoxyribonuclease VII large subunit
MEAEKLTVSQYLALVNQTLARIPSDDFFIVGEVSGFGVSQQKWVNFSLKDEQADAKIPCFMTIYQLGIPLEDGMKIEVRGRSNVYEKFGKFSLSISAYNLVGEGALLRAYQMLKQKLEQEGLFDVSRKRALPRFPQTIGLITSAGAAAYGDFLRILGNRFGGLTILHAPVAVQGSTAVEDIVSAFLQFNNLSAEEKPDVLVLTRGGGSLEDLHAFNDERVVRAVFGSSIPVVVGVGHERDESLCDYAADVRASTPSHAAESVVPDRRDVLRELEHHMERFQFGVMGAVEAHRHILEQASHLFRSFIDGQLHRSRLVMARLHATDERLAYQRAQIRERIENAVRLLLHRLIEEKRQKNELVNASKRLLESFDVSRVLKRGFSLVRSKGKIIRSSESLAPGGRIAIQFAQGNVAAEIVNEKQTKLL